jgi:PsbP-like protein
MHRVQKSIVLIATFAVTSLFLFTIENHAFAIEYTNEKCGISINYPKDWKAEDVDYKIEGMRPIVEFSPNSYNQVSIDLWDISDYGEKTIEYVSEIFRPLEEDTESGVIQDEISEVGGFPAQKLAYFEGIPDKYEFQEDKSHIMEINILAYDRLYQIKLETENQDKFDKYTPFVEEIANSIKISKPNFEGINC